MNPLNRICKRSFADRRGPLTLSPPTPRALALVALTASLLAVPACREVVDESVATDDAQVVVFPTEIFAAAPTFAYDVESGPIETDRTRWGVVRFVAFAGDEIAARVVPVDAADEPRAYLVQRDVFGRYVPVRAGSQSADGVVRATAGAGGVAAGETYLVFRDSRRRKSSFRVVVSRLSGLGASACGAPLADADLVARVAQGSSPSADGFAVRGTRIEWSHRTCNRATGCGAATTGVGEASADPANPVFTLKAERRASDWWLSSPWADLRLAPDGVLRGSWVMLRGDRRIVIPVRGSLGAGCIELTGQVGEDPSSSSLTYDDASVRFVGDVPPRAPRSEDSPDTDCASPPLSDLEILARIPAGAGEVRLGTGVVGTRTCDPDTGCTSVPLALPGEPPVTLEAWAVAVTPSRVALRLVQGFSSAQAELDAGRASTVGFGAYFRGPVEAAVGERGVKVVGAGVAVGGTTKTRSAVACVHVP